ncbi:hypothetical protein EDC01DRAFT_398094 [Geopyxis carbonaria]|nr:hypothetical protein EDC01DRAFT_398094 [Geopyxis carbonaria]
MEPATYTQEQLQEYFTHISHAPITNPTFSTLKSLITNHLSVVPFENISLHYTTHRSISLEPSHLFDKIVGRGHGGYCMEVNGFFSTVLRSLGFDIWTTGAKVANQVNNRGEGFGGWDHMVSIVTTKDKRWLVDVGFGGGGPVSPIILQTGVQTAGIGSQVFRLARKPVGVDQKLDMWILQSRDSRSEGWKDQYCFSDQVEFGREDYEVMNYATSTKKGSPFLEMLVCVRTILEEGEHDGEKRAIGRMVLHNNVLKRRMGDMTVVEIKFRNERKRVQVLGDYFGVILTDEEKGAIQSSPMKIHDQN